MSANLIVDLRNTAERAVSLAVTSGQNTAVGGIVDLLNANTYCNIFVTGRGSGVLPIFVQTSDSTTSGSFTDPTSGLAAGTFPIGGALVSGGIFYANSGLFSSGFMAPCAVVSGAPIFASGGTDFVAFQRPQRYARLICTSGTNALASVPFEAGFISQKKVTGSGTGSTMAPSSGSVSV